MQFNNRQTTLALSLMFFLSAFLLRWAYPGSRIGVDDANIFFSYAQNLANGNGATYSAAFERVEGYTSTLWMLLCSLSFFIGANEAGIFILCNLLTAACATMCIAIISEYSRRFNLNTSFYNFLFLSMIFASPSYLIWMTISLMDTALWGCILMGMLFVIVYSPYGSHKASFWILGSIPFVLSPLARPEATVITPFLLALLWFKLKKSDVKPFKIILSISLLFSLSLLLLTIFRITYFGYPLPSTYYAKVSPSILHNIQTGYSYALDFLKSNVFVSVGALATLFGLMSIQPYTEKKQAFLQLPLSFAAWIVSTVIFILLLLPILTGGDHFALFRFYQPVYPLLCLVIIISLIQFERNKAFESSISNGSASINVFSRISIKKIAYAAWIVLLVNNPSWFSVLSRHSLPLSNEFVLANSGRVKGERLNELFYNERSLMPSIGVIVAGGIAMTYKGPVVDLMGLNNSYMAHYPGDRTGPKNHAAFEKAAFYNLPVDYIAENPNDWFLVLHYFKNLFYDDRFLSEWKYGVITDQHRTAMTIEGFFNNNYLAKIASSTRYTFTETLALDTKTWTGKWLKIKP